MYWWRPRTVLSNATTIMNGLSLIGLEINNSKYELGEVWDLRDSGTETLEYWATY